MSLARPDWQTLRALFDVEPRDDDAAEAALSRPRYNVAPMQPHPIVRADRGERRLQHATWGFAPVDKRLIVNARAETLAQRPRFAGAGRCVVPADGFYEWQGEQPYWFHATDGTLLLLAGLWEPGPTPGSPPRFVVVTTAANGAVAPVHDRMPVLLAPACVDQWLTGLRRPASELLMPAPAEALLGHPVSSRVNAAAVDEPGLLDPVRPRGQLSLL